MNLPTLRQLEYVVALADTLSFRRAAARCGVGQSSLSAQLAQVEELLGLRLFERDNRGVVPTAPGRELIPRARAVLRGARDIVDCARARTAPLTGTLRLGALQTIAPYLLPKVIGPLRELYPRMRLELEEDHTRELLAALRADRLDAALLCLEADLGDLRGAPLVVDPFWVLAPARHRLASRERVEPADLAGEEFLLLRESHCTRIQMRAICDQAGARCNEDTACGSLATLVQLVAAGLGLTLLPQMARCREAPGRAGGPVALPFVPPAPARTVGLVWSAGARDEEFQGLADALRDALVG